MSTFLEYSGRLGRGGFAFRFLVTAALWVGLVFGVLHYVGKVWPREYQIHHAIEEERVERAKAGISAAVVAEKPGLPSMPPANLPATPATAVAATPAAAAPAAAATTASSSAVKAPAAPNVAATAPAGALAAVAAAPAGAKPGAKAPLPHDNRLDGLNRHAYGNVSIFYAIVISTLAAGVVLSHVIRRLRDAGIHGYWSIGMLVPGVLIGTTYVMHRHTFEAAPVTPLQWFWAIVMILNALIFAGVLLSAFFKPSAAGGDTGHSHAH